MNGQQRLSKQPEPPQTSAVELIRKHGRRVLRVRVAVVWWWNFYPAQKEAVRKWLNSYPAHTIGVIILCIVILGCTGRLIFDFSRFNELELDLSRKAKRIEEKIERKQQLLAAALSHLDENPRLTVPAHNQTIINRPIVEMKWEYSAKNAPVGKSSEKAGGSQSADRHSIVEIRSAATPLEPRKVLVAENSAWYPISYTDKLQSGTYLWRAIRAEIDSSGKAIAEGNWGPFFVFSYYDTVYDRIKATRQIMIGAYSVEQLEVQKQSMIISGDNQTCLTDSVVLSKSDSELICSVAKAIPVASKNEIDREVRPVIKQYSNIDKVLLRDLKDGELDIAFGSISSADYRKNRGIYFVEYRESKPMLVTTNEAKAKAKEIGINDKICTFEGTVYEAVAQQIKKEQQKDRQSRRYQFETCKNTYDAIAKLYKNEISWVFMDKRTWDEFQEKDTHKLFLHTTSEILKRVDDELGDDAFAMKDKMLCNVMCSAVKAVQKQQDLQNVTCSCE